MLRIKTRPPQTGVVPHRNSVQTLCDPPQIPSVVPHRTAPAEPTSPTSPTSPTGPTCPAETSVVPHLPTTVPAGLMTLPEHVRTEARERAKFLACVRERKRQQPQLNDPAVVAQVAVEMAEAFPTLTASGQHGRSQLTYNNYRNWKRRIADYRAHLAKAGLTATADDDLIALASSYRRGSIFDTPDHLPADPRMRQFWQDFNAAYLSQNKLEITTAREIAVFALRRRDPTAVPPTIGQVRYYVKHLPLEALIAGREGEVAWRNAICDYITRDWSATAPGELLIGDSRDFDTRVRVQEGDRWIAVRPKIACLLDARSWVPAAWTLTVKPVNGDIIMQTLLQYCLRTEGEPPAMCYFDNGKDYCKQGFSTPLEIGAYRHSVFRELGVTLTNATPFNARAKTVERFFRDMMKQFDKLFPDYLGSNPLERTDAASYFDEKGVMELPTLEEFAHVFDAWLNRYLQTPKSGEIHRGKSPAELWDARPAAGRKLSPLELAFAFLLPVGLRRVMRGPAVVFRNRRYFCDEVRVGETVLIKANIYDPEMVMLCRPDGAAVGIARTRLAVRAIVGDSQAEQTRLDELISRQNRMRRECRDMLAELTGNRTGISAIEFLLSLGTNRQFVPRGAVNLIKGKSHTFRRIAPDENVFALETPPEECGTTPELDRFDYTGEPEPVAAEAAGLDAIVAEETVSADALADFHAFINNPKGEEEENE